MAAQLGAGGMFLRVSNRAAKISVKYYGRKELVAINQSPGRKIAYTVT